jgi:ankyrin repeat protein
MQRKVKKVFNALSKKGMVRAFIETEKKEYIYPLITSKAPKKPIRKTYITLLGVIILSVVGITLYNQLIKSDVTQPVSPVNSLNQQDGDGMTQLHHAVIQSDMEAVKALIEKGADINIRDNYGWTPLHWAVFKGDEAIRGFLVQKGASVTIKTTRKWFKYPAGLTAVEMEKIVRSKK